MISLAETFNIGCESKEVAIPGIHNTTRWDRFAVYSFNDIRCVLSLAFANTHILYQENIITDPVKHCFLLPKIDLKKKTDNKETFYDVISWMIENMIPPKPGIIISLYFYDSVYPQLMNMPTQDKTAIWPLKNQWKNGDYITVHKFESITEQKRKDRSADGQYDIIQNIESYSSLPVKYIDYTMSVNEMVDLLQHSKKHFTYDGATWHLASMINTPTVVYGIQKFDTYNKGYWDPIQDKKHNITIRETPFHIRTIQYDIKKEIVYAGPQTFCMCSRNKEELLFQIKNPNSKIL